MTTAPDTHSARHAALIAAHGQPAPADTAAALRALGLRGQVHPRDAYAFTYRDAAAARAFADANAAHNGIPSLGVTPPMDGPQVIGVLDLRPALARLGAPATDPALPDQWAPAGRRGGRRRAT